MSDGRKSQIRQSMISMSAVLEQLKILAAVVVEESSSG